MGVAVLWAQCYTCGGMMPCNPKRVPSLPDEEGVRQPICQQCIRLANVEREKQGSPMFEIAPDAYEPIDETEL